jgi:alpha-tubulin suppressor-like RCC1 family protein
MLAGNDAVARIRLGERHTCVRLDGGDVRCWGSGDDGRLGYGTTQPLGALPGPIAPLVAVDAQPGKVRDLILGKVHTCALVDGGAVRCWGGNSDGQLARGDTGSVGDQPGEMPPKDALIYDNP